MAFGAAPLAVPGGDEFFRTTSVPSGLAVRWRPRTWMTDIAAHIAPRGLSDVCLVGTHNTGSFGITKGAKFADDAPGLLRKRGPVGAVARLFSSSLTSPWARCQSMSALEQLQFGVRYFDLRVVRAEAESGPTLFTTHGMLGAPLDGIVDDVRRFFLGDDAAGTGGSPSLSTLSPDVSKECIILDFQHIFGIRNDELEEVVFAALKPIAELIMPRRVSPATPLQDIWADGIRRIFVIVGRALGSHYPQTHERKQSLISVWPNAHRPTELVGALDAQAPPCAYVAASKQPTGHDASCGVLSVDWAQVRQHAAMTRGVSQRFYVTQAVLTPTASEVTAGILTAGIGSAATSVRDIARKVNPPLLAWFFGRNTRAAPEAPPIREGLCNIHRNVLLLDYPELGGVELRGGVDGESLRLNSVSLCVLLNLLGYVTSL